MSVEQTPGDWAQEAEARVLQAALPLAQTLGWTWKTVLAAGAAAGLSAGDVELLMPNGPRDLAALFSRFCDGALKGVDPAGLKVRERIRQGVMARLVRAMATPEAARRWAGFLALPANAPFGLRLAWDGADAVWRWAGDRSADENHYSKRAILAEINASTLLVWVARGEEAAAAHLDRRIEGVMVFERWKAKLKLEGVAEAVAEAVGRLRWGRI